MGAHEPGVLASETTRRNRLTSGAKPVAPSTLAEDVILDNRDDSIGGLLELLAMDIDEFRCLSQVLEKKLQPISRPAYVNAVPKECSVEKEVEQSTYVYKLRTLRANLSEVFRNVHDVIDHVQV